MLTLYQSLLRIFDNSILDGQYNKCVEISDALNKYFPTGDIANTFFPNELYQRLIK